MPRCCVPGCDTGTSAEIVRTRRAKVRNKSTFLLPADYKLFRKWEKVLRLKYDTDDGRSGRVCELHFDEADIIRHYYKQMEDNTVQQFTFSRPTLKKGIIPLSTPRKEDLSPNNQKKGASKDNIEYDILPEDGTKRSRSSSEDDDDDEDYVPSKKYKSSHFKRANKNYEKRVHSRTPRNKLVSNSKKSSPPIYDFDRLLHNLRRKNCRVPKGWKFSILDNDTARFVYILDSSKTFLTCTLKRETSLEIKAFNPNVVVNLEFKFASQPHLLESLVSLQKLQCCKGITNNRFAKRCKGFVLLKDEKRKRKLENFGRCGACKKVWKTMIRRQSHCYVIQYISHPVHSKVSKVKLNGKLLKCSERQIMSGKK